MGKRKKKKKDEVFKPIFPLEKILTMSAETYFDMVGKNPGDYVPRGVHYQNSDLSEYHRPIVKEFREKIPEGAEVVVNYKPFAGGTGSRCNFMLVGASGTALIPRPKREEGV